MNLYVLGGIVSSDVAGLIVPGMDNQEALDVHDNQRLGSELRTTHSPWADCKSPHRRKGDGLVYSECIVDGRGDLLPDDCVEACACNEGSVCIFCCTRIDFETFSPGDLRQVDVFNHRDRLVYNRVVEVFDLVMPWSMALRLGFVAQ
jgi:hypothetical protein